VLRDSSSKTEENRVEARPCLNVGTSLVRVLEALIEDSRGNNPFRKAKAA